MYEYEKQFTITADVRPNGTGEAGTVRITVHGSILEQESLDTIARAAANEYNLSDSTEVTMIPHGTTNLKELVNKYGAAAGHLDELVQTAFYEAILPNDDEEGEL